MRICITGSPKAGKSTLANLLAKFMGLEVYSTDDLKELEWSVASDRASTWFDEPGSWIIEGVTIPRALRKWQVRNLDKPPPFDWFILLPNPRGVLEKTGQETLQKQVVGLARTQREWIGERWIEL